MQEDLLGTNNELEFAVVREMYKEQEFTKTYEMYVEDIYRLSFSFMKNHMDAEDVVQETFMKYYHSEKDFEDIPVIFLTSRMDKESVHKVISLKPSGYLLKTLSPEKIKKEVDDFFKKKSS